MPPAVDFRRSKQFIENLLEQLERYERFVADHLKTAKAKLIQHRLDELSVSWTVYQKMLPPYELMDTEVLTDDVRAKLEESYIFVVSEFEERLDELKEAKRKLQVDEGKPQLQTIPPSISAKLPTVDLPIFSGGYLEWKSFIGTFNALIHDNPSLSDRTKFQYLKLSLRGIAASAVSAVELSDENYEVARQILNDRFDKPNFICEQHVHALFQFKPIDRPDSKKLLGLIDHFRSHLRSLESLNRPVKHWDDLIVYIMVSKLDPETKNKWNDAAPSVRLPTVDDITNFLSSRAHRLESQVESTPTSSTLVKPSFKFVHRSNRVSNSSLTASRSSVFLCVHCKENGHTIARCHKFLHLPVDQRYNFVTETKLCYNCLRSDHMVSKCPVTLRCRHCSSSHHSLLHKSANEQDSIHSKAEPPSTASNLEGSSTIAHSKEKISNNAVTTSSLAAAKCKTTSLSFVYLATALVKVLDCFGQPVIGRALLDSGSQLNFMTEAFASLLKLSRRNSSSKICGIGSKVVACSGSSTITLKSQTTEFCTTLDVHVLPKITSYQPLTYIDNIESWAIPSNIKLADPEFFKFQNIDLLLGAEIYQELLSVGQIKLDDRLPILQNTVLGWIIAGKLSSSSNSNHCCHLVVEDLTTLSNQIEKFWDIENFPHSIKPLSSEEAECEMHFKKFTTRDNEGRFVVRLPFSSDPLTLGESKTLATRRFYNLERRLHKSPELFSEYSKFIDEYKRLGHMEHVDPKSITEPTFYLPHHCVTKPESSTTKLRVVFDGSAKTSSGRSLNSIMMVGPVVQSDLFSILVRFRAHAYAFSADIAKMYRQIQVHQDDHRFQLIMWRDSPAEPLSIFKLKTVTYGTSSAPFLSTRCLKQLALEHKLFLPVASDAIDKDIYVDDLLTGTNSLASATEMKRQIINILQSGGMELRKWCANVPEIIKDISPEFIESFVNVDGSEWIKTLGIRWHPSTDKFNCFVHVNANSTISKRAIFAQIAQIYDPLGLVAPVVVLGKLLIQSLWQLKLDWDQSLPQHLHTHWKILRESLILLNNFTIDRHLFTSTEPRSIQIHGFSDASERAYGAVLYVRSSTPDGRVSVKLLCSKSRVAPLKKTTLPRLELCAAVLLAQLTKRIHENLNFKVDRIFYWSDSTITLHWIKSCPSRWKTFVSNRVTAVQEISKPENWLHVPTECNPADLISRGMPTDKFIQSDIWIHGPDFLLQEATFWPTLRQEFPLPEEISEMKKIVPVTVVSAEVPDILTEIKFHNDFRKLKRIIAYILRFKSIPNYKFSGPLKLEELDRALNTIIRVVQRESFPVEYMGLESKDFVVKQPSLRSLSLFLDENHIIRVGGRLHHTSLPYISKHPILLPSSHKFTITLINFYHRKLLHAGPRALLAAVRQFYWPLYGTTVCKKVFQECKECFRVRPIPMTQQMGNLPPERVTISPPFYTVGVDFAGPFYVHYRIRGKPPTKTYLCLFICFVTKAIHLELASDLSTQSFMGCFKRFVSTRGLCKRVFSDNGTNFVGANSELRELYALLSSQDLKEKLQLMCDDDHIEWKFTPPASPNFGGLHESGVKLAKFHLRRTMGTAKFTYEQLMTLIKQVEAVLNSRPLGPMSSGLEDLDCLTPGHFLIGRPLNSLPTPDLTDQPPHEAWKQLNFYHRTFWKRWSTEYLRSLQQRHKWTKPSENLAVGDLVVLIEDNLPPLKWKLGRVVEIYIGKDGLVRVANIKTAQGILKRGISRICRFPQNKVETTASFQGGENVGVFCNLVTYCSFM